MEAHLETLNIDGQHGDKERVYEEPMCDEDNNRKGTELANGASRETGDDTKHGVVGT